MTSITITIPHPQETYLPMIKKARAKWWLAGWTRKRDQYSTDSDPLDLCAVHGRQEAALLRVRLENRAIIKAIQ